MKNNNINGKIIAGYLIIGCMSVSALIGCGTKSNVNNSSAENEGITTVQEAEQKTENEVITTEQEAEQKTETETETSSDKESLFAFEDEVESGFVNLSIDSSLDDISVIWDKVDGASYYRLYRVDMSKVKKDEYGNYENYVEMDRKLIEKIGDFEENKYVDKDVKSGNDYRYYIEAIGKKDGIEKAITFAWSEYRCCGLSKPVIRFSTFDENGEELSLDELNIVFINYCQGTFPDGFIIYRKAEDEKEFKKIDEISNEEMDDQDYYYDKNVEFKKEYTYKVKTYKMKNGESIYSEESNELEIIPTNYSPTYKVSLEGNSKNGREGFEFSIKSDKNNSETVFYKNGGYFGDTPLIMSKYSSDNKSWKEIPKEGVVLKEKEKLYFKFEPTDKTTVDKFEDQVEIIGLNAMPEKLIFLYSSEGVDYKTQYPYPYELIELFFSDGTSRITVEWD
ncbi:MAG: hypothetical protein K6G88_03670 [Lachnospiraceae bacterium]|nr:hypothetical protein [Lachnospiraceae bacterium]